MPLYLIGIIPGSPLWHWTLLVAVRIGWLINQEITKRIGYNFYYVKVKQNRFKGFNKRWAFHPLKTISGVK